MTTTSACAATAIFLPFPGGALIPRFFSEEILKKSWCAINDPVNRIYLAQYLPQSEMAQRDWLMKVGRENDIVFFIWHDEQVIGSMGVHNIDYVHGNATTGSVIWEKRYRELGIATAAKLVLLEYLFNTLNLRRVYSRVIGYNERSAKYSSKCGYQEVARLPNHFRFGNFFADEIILMCERETWLPCFVRFQEENQGKHNVYQTRQELIAQQESERRTKTTQ